jgi:hypothetical protein
MSKKEKFSFVRKFPKSAIWKFRSFLRELRWWKIVRNSCSVWKCRKQRYRNRITTESREHAYEKDVSLMLIDETLTYYYANRANFITFNDFCISMRLYSENSEWQNQNLDKWHSIIFANVIAINQNASLIECLRKMCSQMNIIQRDLNSAYHDSIQLRENIIRACRNYLALIYELINSSMKIFALMNSLQSSIINYEVIRKVHIIAQQQYH